MYYLIIFLKENHSLRRQIKQYYHAPKGIQKVVLQLILFLICFYTKERLYCKGKKRNIIKSMYDFDVEGIDKAKLLFGLANDEFSDFEDCLQMECAKSYGAEYIVTRNVSDYSVSEIKSILPSE